jgi:hypothetical protein
MKKKASCGALLFPDVNDATVLAKKRSFFLLYVAMERRTSYCNLPD